MHDVRTDRGNFLLVAFISVTTLFFAWGFITSMNDPLIPAVRAVFSLNYTESFLTQFAFFIAYGLVSIPAGVFVAKLGYGQAIIWALLAMILGCLIVPLATHVESYAVVLLALFVVASGITVLQVAANPLSAALGSKARSHFRLTLSQAFNSLGTVFGPWLGSTIMLKGGMFTQESAAASAAHRHETLHNIDLAYFLMATLLTALVLFVWRMLPRMRAAVNTSSASLRSVSSGASEVPVSVLAAFKSRWALLGAVAIFFYVGAEVSVASIMINLLHRADVFNIPFDVAGTLLGIFYWGGAMVGRFLGSLLLTRIHAARLLGGAALVAALLCLTVTQGTGAVVGVAALAIGFFNSIMFPVIFTVTLERSSVAAGPTSGLLCTAIVGGAILPPLAGKIADMFDLHTAFVLPLLAYVVIAAIAFKASKVRIASADAHASVSPSEVTGQ